MGRCAYALRSKKLLPMSKHLSFSKSKFRIKLLSESIIHCFKGKKIAPGSTKTTYGYLHKQIHNHTRRDRADEIANKYCASFSVRTAALANGEKSPRGTCRYMMRFGQCTVQGCPHNHDSKWAGFYDGTRSGCSSSRGSRSSKGSKGRGKQWL